MPTWWVSQREISPELMGLGANVLTGDASVGASAPGAQVLRPRLALAAGVPVGAVWSWFGKVAAQDPLSARVMIRQACPACGPDGSSRADPMDCRS